MRLVLRGLGLAVPLLFFHVACGGDDESGPAPAPDAGDDATVEPTEDSSAPPADTGPVKVVNDTNETITVDGQVGTSLHSGETLSVRRAQNDVLIIRFPGTSFFTTLRGKLGWGGLAERDKP